ncbi:MAG TPA: hypothetical protein VEF04_14605 [Blastocatellia bacterium]|nr:hypothetical protein [Blastocatellia bacterium]
MSLTYRTFHPFINGIQDEVDLSITITNQSARLKIDGINLPHSILMQM